MEQKPLYGQRGTVLLAEHDVLVRMPIARYLRECGYRVVEAITIKEAMQAVQDRRFNVTAVVASAQLSGDGFGISRWVKQHRPDLTMLVTGTPKRAVDAAAELCSDDTSPSRLAPQLLLRRIRRMLASRKHPDDTSRIA